MPRAPRNRSMFMITVGLAAVLVLGPATAAPIDDRLYPDSLPPPGMHGKDAWVDARGDDMMGDLGLGIHAISFHSGRLTGVADLRFNGQRICVEDGKGCPVSSGGAIGPAGPQGEPGPAGPQGETGAMGPQGPAGPQGQQGERGVDGVNGKDGLNGIDGADGIDGVNGADGAQGPAGPQGERGLDGAAGATGATGAPGPQGEAGAIGPQGPAGPAGPQGPTGATGPQGEAGATGPQGPSGPRGETGPAGSDGASSHALAGLANGFTGWSGSSAAWTTIPGRSLALDKTSNTSALEIRYAETLGANRNGSSKADNACQFRIVLDGVTVLRSWWQADSFSGNQWTRSSTDRAAMAFGAAAGAHTVAVQVLALDTSTSCDAGTGDTGGFLAVYEDA